MLEIGKYKMVKLTYDLRIDNEQGELVEQATTEQPLEFLYGAGMMLPKFESELIGLKQDDPFTIKIDSTEAYGAVNNEAIVELPKNVFLVNGEFDAELIKVGNTVPMMSSNGQRLNGLVLDVNDETVKMDFNHPLAGEDLFFAGKVIDVREASDEEVAQILSGGGGCGCGSGGGCSTDSCGDGSCGTESGGGCGCGC
ncbi:FKBP-type peptidyl-prolyl cis-trans isomerase SlyD [Draconibacterium orientale]|jgi:FKBP-type peptidyl-prolyl cis-trans isomerase SlyD|uniref:Peptidyl-prolyl cis-trans isomerase n=1 Tax=Draconibacterium orientale TaxID=1168034 RepID=X5E2Y6_9BACT|nr:FKBP-type peptidyl-prolyl cis-trans isomerase [Draconibacterium orientale]AHW60981.1 peptidylprolyl isomerase [Draconibacterium orientale]SET87012.1 FKBP-type peptidyl-prolyl cis-trans isomerase SlyD [Draconibacterium orientale]